MDFAFTEEQTMVRDSLARLLREQYDFDTRREIVASDSGWSRDFWTQLAEMGLLSAPFSEEDGGFGGGPVETMLIMEELGKALAVEPFIPSIVCGGGFLKHGGSDAQKEEHLAGLIGGETVFAFAYTEPGSRYNLAHVATSAKKDGDGYVLNGHKGVVIGALWATHLIVTARTAGDTRDENGLSVFIVAKDADGVSTRDYGTVDGRRASEVYFENVAVGSDALIGEADNALPLIELVADEATAALCAEATGAIEVAHNMTLDYSKQRKQFGTHIGSFQVIQHRLADMFIEHQQAISMSYLATLRLGDEPHERKKAVSSAKAKIGQAATKVGQDSIQIHGGMGMTDELAIGNYFKRLSIFTGEFGDIGHHLKRHMALSKG